MASVYCDIRARGAPHTGRFRGLDDKFSAPMRNVVLST
jgi:hypothetical protein